MNVLVIAEKREIAELLSRAVVEIENGVASDEKTHYKVISPKNEVKISWTQGHALELFDPEDYDPKMKSWSIENLPFNPTEILKKVKDDRGIQNRINFIKSEIKKADEVIHAGDIDDEGQLIVDEVLQFFKYDPTKAKRVAIDDVVLKKVVQAYQNRKSNGDDLYRGMYAAAYSRSVADQLYGLNLSRLYTVAGKNKGYSGVLTVGRVQTPVLSLILQRELINKKHEKTFSYKIDGLFNDSAFKASLAMSSLSDLESLDVSDKKDSFLSKQAAEEIINDIKNFSYHVAKKEKKNFKKTAPMPYSLADLQIECNKRYKMGVDEVLEITQKLRSPEWGLITYNRTDCRYLTDEIHEESPHIIKSTLQNLGAPFANISYDTNLKSKAFNNSKITAHHGIIPTTTERDLSALSAKERKVYELIARNFLAQFLPLKEGYSVQCDIESRENRKAFSAKLLYKYSIITHNGWGVLFGQSNDDDSDDAEELLLNDSIKEGDNLGKGNFMIREIVSRPPPLFTQGSIVEAMTCIAKYAENEKVKKILIAKDAGVEGENGGIGTPATRANIITGLFDKKYITEDKKGNLVTTNEGRALLSALPTQFKAPDLTAIWHLQLQEIVEGKRTVDAFLDGVVTQIKKDIKRVSETGIIENKFAIKCPSCSVGYIVTKTGAKGSFQACSNYPECTHIHGNNAGKSNKFKVKRQVF